MAKRQITGKKPKNFRYTVETLLSYLGRHKLLLLWVAVLVTVSALANLLGTYMIRPVVNSLSSGDMGTLIAGVAVTGGDLRSRRSRGLRLYPNYGEGRSKSAFRYPQRFVFPFANPSSALF